MPVIIRLCHFIFFKYIIPEKLMKIFEYYLTHDKLACLKTLNAMPIKLSFNWFLRKWSILHYSFKLKPKNATG